MRDHVSDQYFTECENRYKQETPLFPQLWREVIEEYKKRLTKIVNNVYGYDIYEHSYMRQQLSMDETFGYVYDLLNEEHTYILDYIDFVYITDESVARSEMCIVFKETIWQLMADKGSDRFSVEQICQYAAETAYNTYGQVWANTVKKHKGLVKKLSSEALQGEKIY